MPSFSAKDYQRSCLESVEMYFTKCQELGDADWAFQKTTEVLAVLESLPKHDGQRVICAAAVKGIGPAVLAFRSGRGSPQVHLQSPDDSRFSSSQAGHQVTV